MSIGGRASRPVSRRPFPIWAARRCRSRWGPLALAYLLTAGGSGYLRLGTVTPFLAAGRLFRVADAPEFSHSAHVVYGEHMDREVLDRVRDGLRRLAPAPVGPEQYIAFAPGRGGWII